MYKNFKLCTAEGNRVAVFIRPVNDETEIYILKCAKKDKFSKETANDAYEHWLGEGQSYFIKRRRKIGHEFKRIDCTPYINLLPVKYNSFNKGVYLKSLFKTFVSASQVIENVKGFIQFLESDNCYVESGCLSKLR